MNTHKLSLPLYIHIPFCRFKCFYCDFNTYAGIENLLPNYVDALMIEIQRWGEALRQNGVESETPTVFFGGGTPSLLKPTQVADVLGAISNSFALRDDAEISMEVNPESVTREFVRDVMALGVNRFSMGAQSLDNSELQMLGRLHDSGGVERALTALRAGGADNINLDLMYGLPRQALETWGVKPCRRSQAVAGAPFPLRPHCRRDNAIPWVGGVRSAAAPRSGSRRRHVRDGRAANGQGGSQAVRDFQLGAGRPGMPTQPRLLVQQPVPRLWPRRSLPPVRRKVLCHATASRLHRPDGGIGA